MPPRGERFTWSPGTKVCGPTPEARYFLWELIYSFHQLWEVCRFPDEDTGAWAPVWAVGRAPSNWGPDMSPAWMPSLTPCYTLYLRRYPAIRELWLLSLSQSRKTNVRQRSSQRGGTARLNHTADELRAQKVTSVPAISITLNSPIKSLSFKKSALRLCFT